MIALFLIAGHGSKFLVCHRKQNGVLLTGTECLVEECTVSGCWGNQRCEKGCRRWGLKVSKGGEMLGKVEGSPVPQRSEGEVDAVSLL